MPTSTLSYWFRVLYTQSPIPHASLKISQHFKLIICKTDYLFFVADKNGEVYFSKTTSEHERIISDLRTQGLWFEY